MSSYTPVQKSLIAVGVFIGFILLVVILLRIFGRFFCPEKVTERLPRRFQPFFEIYTSNSYDFRGRLASLSSVSVDNPCYERFDQPKRRMTEETEPSMRTRENSSELIVDAARLEKTRSVFEKFVTDN
ncbi:uncharacterized protein LOC100907494 [Galendromus occidentalis]|uniref:Uncharacterized protein LOC100907494 n=1 Tax=Galendromus occidentalis TaxID=34638 RepID=A0AAJ6QNN6_9ACAR|nr:uncharacterized protein LOC100907494 [Galendromus occidentalis]